MNAKLAKEIRRVHHNGTPTTYNRAPLELFKPTAPTRLEECSRARIKRAKRMVKADPLLREAYQTARRLRPRVPRGE